MLNYLFKQWANYPGSGEHWTTDAVTAQDLIHKSFQAIRVWLVHAGCNGETPFQPNVSGNAPSAQAKLHMLHCRQFLQNGAAPKSSCNRYRCSSEQNSCKYELTTGICVSAPLALITRRRCSCLLKTKPASLTEVCQQKHQAGSESHVVEPF